MQEVFDDILERFIETGLRIEAKHKIPFDFKDDIEKLSKCESSEEVKKLYDQKLKKNTVELQLDATELETMDSQELGNIKLQLLNAVISTHRKKLDSFLN